MNGNGPADGLAPPFPAILKYPYFVALAALLPLLKLTLPFNSEAVDYVNALAFGLFGFRLLLERRFMVRLWAPAALILAGSLIATYNSPALKTNLVTLVQEVYLFAFLTLVLNGVEDRRDLAVLTTAWLGVAAIEGALVFRQMLADTSLRSIGTFDNPNMAASYLGIAAFLAFAPFTPLPGLVRAGLLLPILAGLFATRSLSATFAVLMGIGVLGAVYAVRAGAAGLRRVLMLGFVALVALTLLVPRLSRTEHFLERAPESVGERSILWRTGLRSFVRNPFGIGIGPAGFEQAGFVRGGVYGVGLHKSLHSDYVSFLAERGVLGFGGLALFLAAIGRALWRAGRRACGEADLRWALVLGGMFLFVLIDALTHEVMHYRHVWLVFGLAIGWEIRSAGGDEPRE